MTFRHLQILATVHGAGSRTKSAERLSISQPSVSQAIRELWKRKTTPRDLRGRGFSTFARRGAVHASSS